MKLFHQITSIHRILYTYYVLISTSYSYSIVYSRDVHSTAREPNLALRFKFFGSLGVVKNSIGFGFFGDHDLALGQGI